MREPRFLVDPPDVAAGRAVIRGEELHHLARVLRLRPGAGVAVFDGRGRGWRARLEAVGRAEAVASLLGPEEVAPEPPIDVTLLAAVLHTDRMDDVVEKATEIGAARIVPVTSERVVVRPRGEGWGRLDRWRRIALAAAKQSGRCVVPEVLAPVGFDEAAARRIESVPAGALPILLHPGGGDLPAVLAAARAREPLAAVALLVGPEGGWSESEAAGAESAGWLRAGLGPRPLRADTASVVALGFVLIGAGVAADPAFPG